MLLGVFFVSHILLRLDERRHRWVMSLNCFCNSNRTICIMLMLLMNSNRNTINHLMTFYCLLLKLSSFIHSNVSMVIFYTHWYIDRYRIHICNSSGSSSISSHFLHTHFSSSFSNQVVTLILLISILFLMMHHMVLVLLMLILCNLFILVLMSHLLFIHLHHLIRIVLLIMLLHLCSHCIWIMMHNLYSLSLIHMLIFSWRCSWIFYKFIHVSCCSFCNRHLDSVLVYVMHMFFGNFLCDRICSSHSCSVLIKV